MAEAVASPVTLYPASEPTPMITEGAAPGRTADDSDDDAASDVDAVETAGRVITELTPDLIAGINKQIAFYFSDINLPTDKKFLKQIRKDPEGFVPIKLFANFRKVRAITKEVDQIAEALKQSEDIVLSSDNTRARRRLPVPEYDVSSIQSRTIIVENLPESPTIESVTDMFSAYGSVKLVRICSKENKGKLPQWLTSSCLNLTQQHAYVEFDSDESAIMAAASLLEADEWMNGLTVRRIKPGSGLLSRRTSTSSTWDGRSSCGGSAASSRRASFNGADPVSRSNRPWTLAERGRSGSMTNLVGASESGQAPPTLAHRRTVESVLGLRPSAAAGKYVPPSARRHTDEGPALPPRGSVPSRRPPLGNTQLRSAGPADVLEAIAALQLNRGGCDAADAALRSITSSPGPGSEQPGAGGRPPPWIAAPGDTHPPLGSISIKATCNATPEPAAQETTPPKGPQAVETTPSKDPQADDISPAPPGSTPEGLPTPQTYPAFQLMETSPLCTPVCAPGLAVEGSFPEFSPSSDAATALASPSPTPVTRLPSALSLELRQLSLVQERFPPGDGPARLDSIKADPAEDSETDMESQQLRAALEAVAMVSNVKGAKARNATAIGTPSTQKKPPLPKGASAGGSARTTLNDTDLVGSVPRSATRRTSMEDHLQRKLAGGVVSDGSGTSDDAHDDDDGEEEEHAADNAGATPTGGEPAAEGKTKRRRRRTRTRARRESADVVSCGSPAGTPPPSSAGVWEHVAVGSGGGGSKRISSGGSHPSSLHAPASGGKGGKEAAAVVGSLEKAKRAPKKDYASWAAATPEYRAAPRQGGGSESEGGSRFTSSPVGSPSRGQLSSSPGLSKSMLSSSPARSTPLSRIGGFAVAGAGHGSGVHIARGPEATGFSGRGRPMPGPPPG